MKWFEILFVLAAPALAAETNSAALVVRGEVDKPKPLVDSQGPLRLIVPGDKVHARWVRQVRTLEIVHVSADAKP